MSHLCCTIHLQRKSTACSRSESLAATPCDKRATKSAPAGCGAGVISLRAVLPILSDSLYLNQSADNGRPWAAFVRIRRAISRLESSQHLSAGLPWHFGRAADQRVAEGGRRRRDGAKAADEGTASRETARQGPAAKTIHTPETRLTVRRKHGVQNANFGRPEKRKRRKSANSRTP